MFKAGFEDNRSGIAILHRGFSMTTQALAAQSGAGAPLAIGMISVEFENDSLRRHEPPDPVSTKRGQAHA
jgi:hypothetical protein